MKASSTFSVMAALFGAASVTTANAAALILDTFDQGDALLTFTSGGTLRTPVSLPVASFRTLNMSKRGSDPIATLAAEVNSGSGHFTISFYDPINTGGRTKELFLQHSGSGVTGPPPYNFSSFSRLEFDFTNVQGDATLLVLMGSPSTVLGPTLHRIPISNGTLIYDFANLNFDGGDSLDEFRLISYIIEIRSPEFGATLAEIRAVPEPASVALLVVAASSGLLRRRRTGWAG